jgi:hypothetical protein
MAAASFFRPDGNVIYDTLDNETIIINLDNGRYYSLNPSATFIWNSLAQEYSAAEIASAFAQAAQQDAESVQRVVNTFIDELLQETLVAPLAGRTHTDARSALNPINFAPPELAKFTDMEELIPLDPIHQVGALGWPFTHTEK